MTTSRRSFLVALSAAGAAVFTAIATRAHAGDELRWHIGPSREGEVDGSSDTVEFLTASILADLTQPPVTIDLTPGMMSEPVDLGVHGIYRVQCTPTRWDDRFGQIYSLVLADAEGKQLDQMNIGGNTTAHFMSFGLQVYVLSVVVHPQADPKTGSGSLP